MKVRLKWTVLLFPLLWLLAGCTATVQNVPMPDLTKVVSDVNKCRIYVIRPSGVHGSLMMQVLDGYDHVGCTEGHGYLCWERPAGNVEIKSYDSTMRPRVSTLKLDCEKGAAYYILQRAENVLEFVSEEEGKRWLRKCNRAKVK